MKFLILFIPISLFYIKGIAQHQYSLEDCFAAAQKNNTTIKKSENDIQNSYIDKKAATYNLLPSLNASAGHYMSFGKSIDPVTNNFVHESFSGGDLNVTMQLNIFAGFNALNTIKSSLYRMQAGE